MRLALENNDLKTIIDLFAEPLNGENKQEPVVPVVVIFLENAHRAATTANQDLLSLLVQQWINLEEKEKNQLPLKVNQKLSKIAENIFRLSAQ